MHPSTREGDLDRLADALESLVGEAGGVEWLYKPAGYRHLGLAILDSMLSLRLRYSSTSRRLEHYCGLVDELDWKALENPGVEHDAERLVSVLRNLPPTDQDAIFGQLKAPGTRRPRREVVIELADILLSMDPPVRRQKDFQHAVDADYHQVAARVMGISGVGSAAWRYLINLNRLQAAKPDTMVVRWVRGVLPDNARPCTSASSIGKLFEDTVTHLAERGNLALDIRTADHLVWRKESGRSISRQADASAGA